MLVQIVWGLDRSTRWGGMGDDDDDDDDGRSIGYGSLLPQDSFEADASLIKHKWERLASFPFNT